MLRPVRILLAVAVATVAVGAWSAAPAAAAESTCVNEFTGQAQPPSVVLGDRDDRYFAQNGDTITANGGNDTIRTDLVTTSAVICTGDGADTVAGQSTVGSGRLSIRGGAGGDFLAGGYAADVVNGVAGNDQLFGGGGDDVLKGGDGVDSGNGGAGWDVCVGVEFPVDCEVIVP